MLLDDEALKRSSVVHPQVQEFFDANPMPAADPSDYAVSRAVMAEVSRQGLLRAGAPEPSLVEEYIEIPVRDGHRSRAKVYRPGRPPSDSSPLIAHIYGGGWVSGDCDQSTYLCRAWVRLFGAVVVSISYRLAPENKWPTPWTDAWDGVVWTAEHAAELGADPAKGFVVGGVSAGGSLSAFITAESQTQKLAHPITGQWLCVPSLMDAEAVPEKYRAHHRSLEHNKHAPILPVAALDALRRHSEWDGASPMRYPALYPAEVLRRLPRTYLQADGLDPLRDDALIYHEMLREAGVEAQVDLYEGCPHGHFAFMPGIGVSETAETDVVVNVGWLLGRVVSVEEARRAMRKPEA